MRQLKIVSCVNLPRVQEACTDPECDVLIDNMLTCLVLSKIRQVCSPGSCPLQGCKSTEIIWLDYWLKTLVGKLQLHILGVYTLLETWRSAEIAINLATFSPYIMTLSCWKSWQKSTVLLSCPWSSWLYIAVWAFRFRRVSDLQNLRTGTVLCFFDKVREGLHSVTFVSFLSACGKATILEEGVDSLTEHIGKDTQCCTRQGQAVPPIWRGRQCGFDRHLKLCWRG